MVEKILTIDLSENYLKILEGRKDKGQLEIIAFSYQPTVANYYNSGNEKLIVDQGDEISTLVDSLKIKEKEARVVIPDSYSYSQVITMPRLKKKELYSAVKYQADQFIPMPLSEAVLDIDIIMDDKKNNQVMVLLVAAAEKIVTRVQKTIEVAGLIPTAIETELSANARLIVKLNNEDSVVYVNLTKTSTSLYFYSGRKKLITKTYNFNIGIDLFLKELEVNLNVDSNESFRILYQIGFDQGASINAVSVLEPIIREMVKNINRFIVTVQEEAGEEVKALYLFNEAILVKGLVGQLTTLLNLKTLIFRPTTIIKNIAAGTNQKLLTDIPLYITSLGSIF